MTKVQIAISALLVATLAACGEQRADPTAPHIATFSATPGTLAAAEGDVTLSWEIQGSATELVLTPGVGPVSGSSVHVSPKVTTVYTLTARNALGSSSAKTTVNVPDAPDPGSSESLNDGLMGPWVFEIVGDEGTTVSGEFHLDADFTHSGAEGVWGAVSECRGGGGICKAAPWGGLIHEPGTDVYRFGLGKRDGTRAFRGRDADGKLSENVPLHFMLEGRGLIEEDEAATFVVYQLGK